MTSNQPGLEEMLAALPKITLFAIFMKQTDAYQGPSASAEGRRLLTEHLRYLFDLQRAKTLYAAGPMDIDVGRFEGLCIVRADSREDAERIAHAEPYHKAGWRTNSVRSWQLYEGLLVDTVKELMVGRAPAPRSTPGRFDEAAR